jgi:hypothetical protein
MPHIEEIDENGNAKTLVSYESKQDINTANLTTKDDLLAMEQRIMKYVDAKIRKIESANDENPNKNVLCFYGMFFAFVGFTVHCITRNS